MVFSRFSVQVNYFVGREGAMGDSSIYGDYRVAISLTSDVIINALSGNESGEIEVEGLEL